MDSVLADEAQTQVDPMRTTYVFDSPERQSELFERLFLANSFDLIELLVKFNLAHNFPQLVGCKAVEELRAKQLLMYSKQVDAWQKQRG